MEYRHTQIGKTAYYVLIWGLIIVLIAALSSDERTSAVAPIALITFVITGAVFLFSRLTVTVGSGVVTASFGFGWPKRTLQILDIAAFRQVRNHWYLGWGVRKVPGGWMYNVWGLDAVELTLHSGKRFRIGTDDAPDLLAALSLHTTLKPDPAD